MRIDAYRNLHKPGRQYTVRHRNKVVDYFPRIVLTNCTMKHASAKQLDFIRTRKRRVCQWVKGEWDENGSAADGVELRRLECNPKAADGFVDAETGNRVDDCLVVVLDENGAWYA